MEKAPSAQQVTRLLLGAAGLIVALVLGWNIGSSNFVPVVMVGAVVGGLGLWLFSGQYFWVITIASSFLLGTFPILGGAFTPFQLLIVIGVAKFVVEGIIFGRKRLQTGNRIDTLLICGFMGVLTLHGLHDRFGMRFLGSTVWGGRNYVNVYVGLAAFFIIQSVPISEKHWRKLPYLVLAVSGFDLFIAVVTTIFPSTIYRIYPFYSAVSLLGIEQIVSGESDVTGRVGAFGSFGFVLITLILASTSVRELFHPRNFYRLCLIFVGLVAVLFSGFRSWLLNVVLAFFAAAFRDLKFKMVLLIPLIVAILLGLSGINSYVYRFPKQVQRALSFVPGTWDVEMVRDAEGSNEFRERVWKLWVNEYFPKRPMLGRGFGFNAAWAQPSIYYNTATDYQQHVEVQNLHNGLFASLDTFGVVGTIFFAIWILRMLFRALQVPFARPGADATACRFVAIYLIVWILTYWFGAQTVGTFLPVQFALGGALLSLRDKTKRREGSRLPEQTVAMRQRAMGYATP